MRRLGKSGPYYGVGAPRVHRTPGSETGLPGTARPVAMGVRELGAALVYFPALGGGGMLALANCGPSPVSDGDIQTNSCGRGSR